MCAHVYIARVKGGALIEDGPEGPARVYPLDALPEFMPIRVANQRVLAAYLEQRGHSWPLVGLRPGRIQARCRQTTRRPGTVGLFQHHHPAARTVLGQGGISRSVARAWRSFSPKPRPFR